MNTINRNSIKNVALSIIIMLASITVGFAIGGKMEPKNDYGMQREQIQNTEEVNEELMQMDELVFDMKENFKDMFQIVYDEERNIILMVPTDQNLSLDIKRVMDGTISSDSWDSMVSTLSTLSQTMSKVSGNEELAISMVNPVDVEESILVIQNGNVIYDVSKDKRGK